MDIKNYFVSIDKQILFDELLKQVDEPWLQTLIEKVIFHDPRKNVWMKSPKKMYDQLPKYKSLLNTPNEKGLPIGNLTSQFFSNVYLHPLDYYAKHVLKCKRYLRYVDDILILDEDPSFLNYAYAKINRFLIDNLKMELNHKKKNMNLVSRGFDFLGLVIKPNQLHLRVRTKNKCLKCLKDWKNNPNRFDEKSLIDFRNQMNSYFGMSRHTDGYSFRENIAKEVNCLFIRADKEYKKLETA